MQPINRFFIGLILIALIVFSLIIFIDRKSNSTTLQDVAIKHVIDSLTTAHNAELMAREDSLQALAYSNIALLQTEKDKAQANARTAEQKLKEQNRTIADLEAQYAEQCGELITTYRERHDTAMSVIKSKTTALSLCEAQRSECADIVKSAETKIAALTKTVNTKNETIATQRDYITGVTNRADRSFLFRNWKWLWGNWSDYVLGK
jgi:chromosome segregation ATPase